jgi:DNA processing protein
VLATDPEPTAVVFLRGHRSVLDGPRVAVVGTRNCTRVGRDIARELGHGLAAAGVRVVSGLALGIDGASHRGALDAGGHRGVAPPVAVVAGGLDIVYPRRHLELQREVERRGLVVSEAPLGTPPEPWRFPARNRIIAALAQAVVVVESREVGGSMHTADEALERGIPVLAVPGGVRSRASSGTNLLLAEGATPARDVDDVLAVLGLAGRRPACSPVGTALEPADRRLCELLDAMGGEAVTFEQLVVRTGMALAPLARLVADLESQGWVCRTGGWLERTGGGRG